MTSTRRVVQVVTQREAGGAQRVAVLLHEEMRRRGTDAQLWFLFPESQTNIAPETGVFCLSKRRPRLYEVPGLLLSLAWNIRRFRPCAMITHTHYANVIVAPIARLCGVPARLAVHHNAISTYPALARILEYVWKRCGMYSASIAVSEDVKASLLQWRPTEYTGKVRRIYNGLPHSVGSRKMYVPSSIPSSYPGRAVLFNAGRLTSQKNQQALIRSLTELPDCVAVIAGRGPMHDSLVELARELKVQSRLKLLGEVGPEVIAEWMRGSSVFVFPSKFEAMPMALLEAMRAGMAIVASDIPAHREVAGGAVLLTETNPINLSMAIESALRQLAHGNPLGAMAHQRSVDFTVQRMADAYMEAF